MGNTDGICYAVPYTVPSLLCKHDRCIRSTKVYKSFVLFLRRYLNGCLFYRVIHSSVLYLHSCCPSPFTRWYLGRTCARGTAMAARVWRWRCLACRLTLATSALSPSTATHSTPCGARASPSRCTSKTWHSYVWLSWRTTAHRSRRRGSYRWRRSNPVRNIASASKARFFLLGCRRQEPSPETFYK